MRAVNVEGERARALTLYQMYRRIRSEVHMYVVGQLASHGLVVELLYGNAVWELEQGRPRAPITRDGGCTPRKKKKS